MKEIVATITSKGQLTLPKAICNQLGVGPHDRVVFKVDDSGVVRVEPVRYPTVASLRGIAGSLKEPLPWREVLRIAHEEAAEGILNEHRD